MIFRCMLAAQSGVWALCSYVKYSLLHLRGSGAGLGRSLTRWPQATSIQSARGVPFFRMGAIVTRGRTMMTTMSAHRAAPAPSLSAKHGCALRIGVPCTCEF